MANWNSTSESNTRGPEVTHQGNRCAPRTRARALLATPKREEGVGGVCPLLPLYPPFRGLSHGHHVRPLLKKEVLKKNNTKAREYLE